MDIGPPGSPSEGPAEGGMWLFTGAGLVMDCQLRRKAHAHLSPEMPCSRLGWKRLLLLISVAVAATPEGSVFVPVPLFIGDLPHPHRQGEI